jgi:hypothetical protein
MVIVSSLLILIILLRVVQVYLFIKQVSKECDIYDWMSVDENPLRLIEILEDDYYVTAEWSAYNFLFLKGPSPLSMFFSFKRLTIENIYSKEVVARLNGDEIN